MTMRLIFEQSASGQLEGINDAGVETFAGNHLGSLAREQCQNSLDAKVEGAAGPVDVRYDLLQIPIAELPGASDLRVALGKIKSFWSAKDRTDKKVLKIVEKATALLSQDTVNVLRVSDRNTKGLRGSTLEMSGDWFSLTKSSGVSLKGEGKLGSFGIGKNVFWANSRLRMVYFSTHDIEDKWAFQGVAKWASHEIGPKSISRAVGFCGEEKDFAPIRGKAKIPSLFQPDGVGTDIYVAGFEGGSKWEDQLVAAFAENFFVAFNRDWLRVKIGSQELSSGNIGDFIAGLSPTVRNSNLKNFYDALTSNDAVEFTKDFDKLGTVRVRLLLREGANKKIAMFRATGMLIAERARFTTPLQFAGVCICDSKEGNEYLRRLEPPSHNAWEPERDDDPAAARDEIRALYKWLSACVTTLSPVATIESLDVPELEKFLPDDEEEDERPTQSDKPRGNSEGDAVPVEHLLEGRTKREPPEDPYRDDAYATTEVAGLDDGEEGGPEPGNGGGGNGGGGSGEGHKEGESGGSGGDESQEPTAVFVKYRIFRQPGSDSAYVMRAQLPSKGVYSLSLAAIGDDGAEEAIKPSSATQKLSDGGSRVLQLDQKFRLSGIEVPRGGPVNVEVRISSRIPLSLGARFYRQ